MSGFGSLQSYLASRQMPTGRRLYSFQRALETAKSLGLSPDFLRFLENAIAHDKHTLEIEEKWRIQRKNRYSSRGKAREIDLRIDAEASSINAIIRAHAVGDPDDPNVQLALHT